jgi:mannose-6-phosphate isomerase-like protein (cupin superfamily)
MQARIHNAGEGRALDVLGNPLLEKAGSDDLGGGAAIFVLTVPPAGGPPPHVHRNADEFFYVLDGEVDAWVGGAHVKLRSGMSTTLPRGVVHRFDNLTATPAKVLVVVTPGKGAAFFDDLDRERPELPREIDKVVQTLARHDIHVVG